MKTPVAITKGGNVEERVAKALDLIEAKQKLNLRPDSKILIKPNLARVPAETKYAKYKGAYELTTLSNKSGGEWDICHPEVVAATMKAVRDWGYTDVTLGEAAGGAWTDLVYKAYDIYGMGKKYGVKVTDLNWEDSVKIPVPNRMVMDYVWVPRSVYEADLMISLAAWKCWGNHVTLCLKNVGIGILPGKYYGWNRAGRYVMGLDEPIHRADTRARFGALATDGEVVDVCSVAPIGLGIIDGTTVVHGDQHAERADTIFAGFDPVATDAVALSCMAFDPKKIPVMEMARQRGLGTDELSEIEVRGVPIEKARIEIVPPRGSHYR